MLTSAKKKMSSYVCMSYMDTYGKTGRNEDDSSDLEVMKCPVSVSFEFHHPPLFGTELK